MLIAVPASPCAGALIPAEKWIVGGAVIPPDRMACRVSFTLQEMLVTDSSGTNKVKPAGGMTPVSTHTVRIVRPVVTSRRELVTSASDRIPGWGNGTRTTRLKSAPPRNWLPSELTTLRTAL